MKKRKKIYWSDTLTPLLKVFFEKEQSGWKMHPDIYFAFNIWKLRYQFKMTLVKEIANDDYTLNNLN